MVRRSTTSPFIEIAGQKKNIRIKREKRVLEEHLVVTYCHKYALYQRKTRDEQIARAQTKINRGESTRQKSPNDCRRFIKTDEVTADGVVVEHTISTIDWEKVRAEERFDGFYAYGSSLDDHPLHILKANSYRGDIEALYRVTKQTSTSDLYIFHEKTVSSATS